MQDTMRDMRYEAITHIANDEEVRKRVFKLVTVFSASKHIPFEQGLLDCFAHAMHHVLNQDSMAKTQAEICMVCEYELLKRLGVLPDEIH